MINKIKDKVWKIEFSEFGSIVYFVKLKENNILIDTSSKENKDELIIALKKLNLNLKDINLIILTHNHYDHIENLNLFPNAKIYGSKKDFKEKEVLNIKNLHIKDFEIIETPGHTKGCFCILYKRILFSGDTIFHDGFIGRTDFPESSPKDMKNSLKKIQKLKFDILCPGH